MCVLSGALAETASEKRRAEHVLSRVDAHLYNVHAYTLLTCAVVLEPVCDVRLYLYTRGS